MRRLMANATMALPGCATLTHKFFHTLSASYFLLTVALLCIHVGVVRASTHCDTERAGPSLEVGLEHTITHDRRLLDVNFSQSLEEDGEALLQIKASILTDPYNITYWWKRSGANKALNPCKLKNNTAQYWPGINCTDKRVTGINLSNMNLSGTLSPYLGALTFLESVDLSNNLFTGPIPEEFTLAAHLETLNFANNHLDGELPASLGNWTNLTLLNVANNGLAGQIPVSIGNLKLLQTLNMTGNNLTGAIPKKLNECTMLSQVDLSRNGLKGIVPFQNLTNLTVLYLQENQLDGDFVTSLGTLSRLEDLDLSSNQLNGTIPAKISNLQLRNQLSLGHNNLTGVIPDSLGQLSLVQRINLSNNELTGEIPIAVGSCLSLLELDVSHNDLQGEIPQSLASLPSLILFNASHNLIGGLLPHLGILTNLRVFDAVFNQLTGPIPDDFVDFAALHYLNASFNNLQGEVPNFVAHDNVNGNSFLYNHVCGVITGIQCQPPPSDSQKSTIISIAVGSSVAFVVLFVIMYVCCMKRYEQEKQHKKFATVSTEFELKLTPEELSHATQSFDERNKIGKGSMSTVYRGVLPGDTQVAVKKLAIGRGDINESVEKVLGDGFETLGHVRHWSLVKMLAYCCSPDLTALVIEYMPNGTLRDVMYQKRDSELVREFNWNHRFNTAIGVAEGLKYLHHECNTPTVHGDLKPTNILFNTFMEARITDFGVAKLFADHGVAPRPTLEADYDNSYKAPESANLAGYTMKGDVYSFGIIILEMISGRSPRSLEAGQDMPQWIRNMLDSKALQNVLDPVLLNDFDCNQQKMSMVLGVALLCTREHPQERPYITEVLKMLTHIKSRPQGEGKGCTRLRSRPSTHQRNEEIRQEVPGIEITPSPPITPPAGTPAPPLYQQSLSHSAPAYSPQLLPLQSLPHNPSLSAWTPTAENRRASVDDTAAHGV